MRLKFQLDNLVIKGLIVIVCCGVGIIATDPFGFLILVRTQNATTDVCYLLKSIYKLDDEAKGSTLFRNRGGFVVTTERSEVVT